MHQLMKWCKKKEEDRWGRRKHRNSKARFVKETIAWGWAQPRVNKGRRQGSVASVLCQNTCIIKTTGASTHVFAFLTWDGALRHIDQHSFYVQNTKTERLWQQNTDKCDLRRHFFAALVVDMSGVLHQRGLHRHSPKNLERRKLASAFM